MSDCCACFVSVFSWFVIIASCISMVVGPLSLRVTSNMSSLMLLLPVVIIVRLIVLAVLTHIHLLRRVVLRRARAELSCGEKIS